MRPPTGGAGGSGTRRKETSIEPASDDSGLTASGMRDTLVDEGESPFDSVVHEEVRARVEEELRQISEPYRTSVILRDLEDMSYEEIAEITQVSLGTVKSRLTRGREALRRRLTAYVMENGQQLGLRVPEESNAQEEIEGGCAVPVDRGDAMTCAQAKPLFSPYLDGAVTGTPDARSERPSGVLRPLPPALCFAAAHSATADPGGSAEGAA